MVPLCDKRRTQRKEMVGEEDRTSVPASRRQCSTRLSYSRPDRMADHPVRSEGLFSGGGPNPQPCPEQRPRAGKCAAGSVSET